MLLPNMGLTLDQLTLIKTQVHVIVHSASSIALLKSLEKIVEPVIIATERLAGLGLECELLECFVYVSTAYCNAYLFAETDGTSQLEVQELVYPLHSSGEDTGEEINQELQEVTKEGSSLAYRSHSFPWAYGYAKQLAERLLHQKFASENKRLLIVRPSVIEPAQCFPYRKFCIPTSTPHIIFTAGLALTLSKSVCFSSRFDDPLQQSSIDYVPVDVVVDRLLAHVSYGTYGPIHAVAGPMPFQSSWERTIKLRRVPLSVQPAWTSQSWNSKALHPLARIYKAIGTSFRFSDKKTHDLWQDMSHEERGELHLFADMQVLFHDHEHMRPDHIWHCIMHLTAHSRLLRIIAKLVYRDFKSSVLSARERAPYACRLCQGISFLSARASTHDKTGSRGL